MDAKRWAIVDGDGAVVNVVLWDGDTDTWQPPEGTTPYELADDAAVQPGDRWEDVS